MGGDNSKAIEAKKKRVVVAGLGDAGLLTATRFGSDYEVVAISPKPCFVTAQEMGTGLTAPEQWSNQFMMDYDRCVKLDKARILHGKVASVDAERDEVTVTLATGETETIHYDAFVIATGCSGGFWRTNAIETKAAIADNLSHYSQKLMNPRVRTVAVVGAGPSGVSTACNTALRSPDKKVHLFYSQDLPLVGYHEKARTYMVNYMKKLGITLHPGHRAVVPVDFNCDDITHGELMFENGASLTADAIVWSLGRLTPNSQMLPKNMLDAKGFVKCDNTLKVTGYRNVFAVGDIAVTPNDPQRTTAKNEGHVLVANNIKAFFKGKQLKEYSPPGIRWGAIIGTHKKEGMLLLLPNGSTVKVPYWLQTKIVWPKLMLKSVYGGVRE